MSKISVFIVDSDKPLIEMIKTKLYSHQNYRCAGSSLSEEEALRKLKVLGGVDILITEIFNENNLNFLNKVRKYNLARHIICTSNNISSEIFGSLNFLKIDYFFLKPYEYKSLFYVMKLFYKGIENAVFFKYIESFNDCSEEEKAIDFDKKKDALRIEEKVTDLLHSIGIPAHIKGYVFIRCAIIEAFYNPTYIGQITKTLYPEIARRYCSTASRVERAIRHAIEIAWNRGSIELINNIFGYTINAVKAKPTNSEFIAMLTDKLRLDLKVIVKI